MTSVGAFRCSQKQATPKTIPLGVQLYSVRSECQKDFVATIQKVAEIGYQGVEFAGFYEYAAPELKQILNDYGLLCCGSHTQLAALVPDQIDATIEFNATIGNKYLIVPWLPEEKRQTIDDWKKLAEEFNQLAVKAESHGMRVGYHNHDFEFKPLDGQLPWDVFAENTNENVILQLDTGNCMHGGADALATLKRYPGRATTIHLKEYSESNPDAILGEGDIPWKEVFAFCENEGATEWYIIEEEKDIYPPLEAIAKCYTNFQTIAAS
ncbi:sugar phosphate isomerase/epimerase [candidate division KSB1 bacterium]|nr:MAG: sugar phosphate isomerase/epimerase [candidate division KSB1 bacterium]